MGNLKQFIKNHQQQAVLALGYLLVALIAFGLGRLTTSSEKGPEIKLQESAAAETNYTPIVSGLQSDAKPTDCKIKATLSSKIYHLPGQNGYDKLSGQMCFETEAAAQEAGYRKALR